MTTDTGPTPQSNRPAAAGWSATTKMLLAGLLIGALALLLAVILAQDYMIECRELRKDTMRQTVRIARRDIEPFVARLREGTLSREEALKQVRDHVRNLTYEDHAGKNYVFMSSYRGIMLVQPFEPAKEGTDVWGLQDSFGTYIIRELIAAATSPSGEGFVSYYYPPPNSTRAEEKISYVIGIPELGCYIGTGMYMQDIRQLQQQYLIKIVVLNAAMLLLLLWLMRFAIGTVSRQNLKLQEENSARKASQEELTVALEAAAKSEERFRALADNAPTVISIVADPDGERFLYANSCWERVTGYRPEDVATLRPRDLVHPEMLEDTVKYAHSCFNGEDVPTLYDVRIVTRGGGDCWLELSSSMIDYDGAPAMLVMGSDITERRRIESELRQAEKMQAVGQLAGGIAHEFKNRLTIINGFSELLLSECKTDEQRRFAEKVLSAGRHAANLTGAILTYSRSDAVVTESFCPLEALNELLPMLEQLLGEDVLLESMLVDSVCPIELNRGQFSDMMINLVVNARDAMPGGGRITLGARCIEANAGLGPYTTPEEGVVITVQDTGLGMKPEVLEHVFEPFFTTKPEGAGTGLGLSMVYGVVTRSGGLIHIDSAPGSGTSIHLYIPSSNKAITPAAVEKPAPVTAAGNETILVIEDEEGVRDFTCSALRRRGYQVLEASGGEDALRILADTETLPDLVLTDVIMPEMSGPEILKAICEAHGPIKALYMSGYSDEVIHTRGRPDSNIPILSKPVDLDTLTREVRAALDR